MLFSAHLRSNIKCALNMLLEQLNEEIYKELPNMKKTIIQLAVFLLLPLNALADCGYLPAAPALLVEPQLTTAQFSDLGPQMEAYIGQIQNYRECINDEINALAPDGAPQEYFSSDEYQYGYSQLSSATDFAQQKLQETLDRYNYLIEIGIAL